MSTVQSGDMIAVYRGSTLYHAPADMSTVQDTDLILVQRGNVPHKCTFADWKASQVSVNKPSLTTPADGATDVSSTPTFTSSAFSGTGVTHASTDWQVTLKTDTGFASPVVQSMADATNLVSWKPGTDLNAGTDYIARVRHNGSGGVQSPWSDVVSFKTKQFDPIATVTPGDLYYATTLAATGAFLPASTKLPDNADGTAYIDIASCADDLPALLLDTNNALWVSSKSRGAPTKATPPIAAGAKIVKICGSQNPSYQGNCLALADDGTLWRGWNLGGSKTWAQVTGTPFPISDISSLSSQSYSSNLYARVIDGSSGSKWYAAVCTAEVLGAWTELPHAANCVQLVQTDPFNAGTSPANSAYGLRGDGVVLRISDGATVYNTKPVTKLLTGGYRAAHIFGLCKDNTIVDVIGGGAAMGLPAGKLAADFLAGDNGVGYYSRHMLLTTDGEIWLTATGLAMTSIIQGSWYQATDLTGKIKSFGSTSDQPPVNSTQFHLLIPR